MGNTSEERVSFWDRGGGWVLAQGIVILFAILIPVVSGTHFDPGQPVQIAGVFITAIGLALSLVAVFHLGEALTPFPRPLTQAALRSSGVYAVVRHPIYSGLLLATVGWSLWWLSAYGLLYTIFVAVFFDRKAAYEERWLYEKHRDVYADYKKRVKKFFPWIY
jgi:protein-S-isoprenylcysteine O-methyltransferase Ste14